MSEPSDFDEWKDLPLTLTVEEAARLLRIGRSHAYNLIKVYFATDGIEGLPALRLGDLLRVPKAALHQLLTTGRVVQLITQPAPVAIDHATGSRPTTRKRRTSDHAQLSLLGSD